MRRQVGNWVILTGDDTDDVRGIHIVFVDGSIDVSGTTAWAVLAIIAGVLFLMGWLI